MPAGSLGTAGQHRDFVGSPHDGPSNEPPPTVIDGLDHDDAVQEKIFGSVLVFRWDDYDEMIELANDIDYGLAGGVNRNG